MYSLLLCFLFIGHVYSQSLCETPVPGVRAYCVPINQCPKLHDLLKRGLTPKQLEVLKKSYCGTSPENDLMVCCPAVVWRPPTGPVLPSPPAIPLSVTVGSPPASDDVCKMTTMPTPKDTDCCGRDSGADRLLGGQTALPSSFPWTVLLDYGSNGMGDCGGSLISSRYVLTAAHCFTSQKGKPISVRLAEYNLTSYPEDVFISDGNGKETIVTQSVPIDTCIPHPKFNRTDNENDIGLVRLSQEAEYGDYIRPICLPTYDITKQPGQIFFTVAGWGRNVFEFNQVKQFLENIPYTPRRGCQHAHDRVNKFSVSRTIYDSQICAGGEKDKDTCTGDSGSGLMYDEDNVFMAVGVSSYGLNKCGTEGVPAIYTHVYKYMDWIMKTISQYQ